MCEWICLPEKSVVSAPRCSADLWPFQTEIFPEESSGHSGYGLAVVCLGACLNPDVAHVCSSTCGRGSDESLCVHGLSSEPVPWVYLEAQEEGSKWGHT